MRQLFRSVLAAAVGMIVVGESPADFPGPDYGKIGRDFLRHTDDVLDRYFPNRREPPSSPQLANLFGAWNASCRNASGIHWTGRVVFQPSGQFAVAAQGRTPGGQLLQRRFSGWFGYYANDNLMLVTINPVVVKNNRLTWIHAHRFVVSESDGSRTVYDRTR